MARWFLERQRKRDQQMDNAIRMAMRMCPGSLPSHYHVHTIQGLSENQFVVYRYTDEKLAEMSLDSAQL